MEEEEEDDDEEEEEDEDEEEVGMEKGLRPLGFRAEPRSRARRDEWLCWHRVSLSFMIIIRFFFWFLCPWPPRN